jgi:hypothetical protein
LYKSEWMVFFMQPLEGRGLYHSEMAKLDASSCARARCQAANVLPCLGHKRAHLVPQLRPILDGAVNGRRFHVDVDAAPLTLAA